MSADDHTTLWMDCGCWQPSTSMCSTKSAAPDAARVRRSGNLHVDVTKGEIQIYDAKTQSLQTLAIEAERNEMFVDEAKHFLSCIRESALRASRVKTHCKP